jgi:hypothetical protein
MGITASIKVTYWFGEGTIEGIEQFSDDLAQHYVANVRGRRAGLGGGLYQLTVEFLSHLTFKEIATILLEGIAYDLIKTSSKEFLIKPFLDAYRRLKEQAANRRVDVETFVFTFQDTKIVINGLPKIDILTSLGDILLAVAQHFETIAASSKDRVFEIRIPVMEDDSADRVARFRDLVSVDEPIDISRLSTADYFRYWGIELDYDPRKVYDVQARTFVAEHFLTEPEYWTKRRELWEKRQNKREPG